MTCPCPRCADGTAWSVNGPTSMPCRACGGTGMVPDDEALELAERQAVAEESQWEAERDDRLTGDRE